MALTQLLITLSLMITCAVSQNDICSYIGNEARNISVGVLSTTTWTSTGACICSVRTNAEPVTEPTFVQASMLLHFQRPEQEDDWGDENDQTMKCDPMYVVSFAEGARPKPAISEDFMVCPSKEESWDPHKSMVVLYPGQEMRVHINNPRQYAIQSSVTITGERLSIECSDADAVEIIDTCPCWGDEWGDAGAAEPFDEKRRLMIGLVVAFVALAIVAVIIIGVIFYRRRKAKKQLKADEAVTVENKGYEGSKQNVNDNQKQPLPRDANVNYAPDPTLNLQMQKGHHGSHDSGLASSNDPQSNDKRLPFMQPHDPNSSIDNLTRMPENYPPLAGGGSLHSLDHVEPIYTTRQPVHQGPRAGNPAYDNYPPPAGRGSRSSLDDPKYYGGPGSDAENVYAKVNKPTRSASHDNLNAPEQEVRYASGEDLNASRVTIETDV